MPEGPVTRLLARLREGDAEALDRLIPLVYDELRSLARAQLRREDPGHTLGSTALVHEAYMRMAGRGELGAADRRHFFAIAAQAMRRVLIDHARTRKRKKRGSGRALLPLDDAAAFLSDDAADELTAIDEALERLAKASPRAARVVECRFFAGLTLQETADVLEVSLKTVQRDWLLARAWLRKEVERDLLAAEPDGDAAAPPERPDDAS
ncbi:MAG TPA: sigma-70 family RNA polymerase sigma factor [Longimicrobiales bacterium]